MPMAASFGQLSSTVKSRMWRIGMLMPCGTPGLCRRPSSNYFRTAKNSPNGRAVVSLLLKKLDNQLAHFLWLFLLNPMPGSIQEMRAYHLPARHLHSLEVAGALVYAPITFSSDKK